MPETPNLIDNPAVGKFEPTRGRRPTSTNADAARAGDVRAAEDDQLRRWAANAVAQTVTGKPAAPDTAATARGAAFKADVAETNTWAAARRRAQERMQREEREADRAAWTDGRSARNPMGDER